MVALKVSEVNVGVTDEVPSTIAVPPAFDTIILFPVNETLEPVPPLATDTGVLNATVV
jgi:hypothetical protein